MEQLPSLFTRAHLRLTAPRKQLFTILETSDGPLSVGDILLQSPGLDRTSVYRTLSVFVNLGIVDSVPIGWKQRYELAGPFKPHHHHLRCTSCHEIIQLDIPKLENAIHAIAERRDYHLTAHHLELSGVCKLCWSEKAQ